MNSSLLVTDLHKSYGARVVFAGWSHAFDSGFHGVTGPNGIGKSTLLAILAGAERCQGGKIALNGAVLGQEPDTYRSQIGYCPDRMAFYPFVKAHEFFHLAASAKSCATPDPAHPLVKGFNLHREWDTRLDELSLGTQKKVLLLTALFSDPDLLLLDEPTDELDAESARFLVDHLLQRRAAITIISTHDRALLDALQATPIALDHEA